MPDDKSSDRPNGSSSVVRVGDHEAIEADVDILGHESARFLTQVVRGQVPDDTVMARRRTNAAITGYSGWVRNQATKAGREALQVRVRAVTAMVERMSPSPKPGEVQGG